MAAALERDRPILEQLIGDVGNQFGELFAIRAVDAFACAVYVLVSLILLIFKFKLLFILIIIIMKAACRFCWSRNGSHSLHQLGRRC